jgi:hypothetical protein
VEILAVDAPDFSCWIDSDKDHNFGKDLSDHNAEQLDTNWDIMSQQEVDLESETDPVLRQGKACLQFTFMD